jgi:hypothetical protein
MRLKTFISPATTQLQPASQQNFDYGHLAGGLLKRDKLESCPVLATCYWETAHWVVYSILRWVCGRWCLPILL